MFAARTLVSPFCIALASIAAAQPAPISTEAWHAVPDARGVQLINVECGAGIFDPNDIVVQRGVPVELSVRAGVAGLSLVTPFTGPPQAVGRSPKVHRFTPSAAGQYTLSCDGVSRPGRAGRLNVVERP